MSGGHFGYKQFEIDDLADDVGRLAKDITTLAENTVKRDYFQGD